MNYGNLLEDVATKFAVEIVLALGGIALAAVYGWIRAYTRAKKRIEEAEQRVTRVRIGTREREGSGIWISQPIVRPDLYDRMIRGSKPVMVFGNLKGGVGKTTCATNLAAHYAIKHREKVLLIDADYQGSASSMLFSSDTRLPAPDEDSRATTLFGGSSGQESLRDLCPKSDRLGMIPGLSIWGVPAYYDLAQAENRLLIEWVIKAEQRRKGVSKVGSRDVRYFLAELLHSGDLLNRFDRVIIDAPPRLTAACIQSLCAATDLVVPTVLDGLSAEAVGNFVQQVKLLRDAGVCPHLRIAGVVAYAPTSATRFRSTVRETLRRILAESGTEAELLDDRLEVPSLKLVTENAGERIPYAIDADNEDLTKLRKVFDNLGDELSVRMAQRRLPRA